MATRAQTSSTNKSDATAPTGSVSAPKQPAKAPVKPAAKIAPKTAAGTGAAPRSTAKTTAKTTAKAPAKAPASKTTAKPAEKPAEKITKTPKPKKAKMIRDSFTMPEAEYSLIAAIKKRCIARGVDVKKSEVLRAAILGLATQTDASLANAVKALVAIKTGRPPKEKK
jgi:hypothetical protein